jgi:Uma2 family endonuclease
VLVAIVFARLQRYLIRGLALKQMTVPVFLDWLLSRPDGERWELVDGAPVPVRRLAPSQAMTAETIAHARLKRRIDHVLTEALARQGHDCEVFVSGPKVQIDPQTAFEPDVVVTCVEVPDGFLVPEPVIVVEALSSSTPDRDLTIKLAGYFSLPSVAQYLLVETERRLIVHHHRAWGDDELHTSIVRAGSLHLAPPGVDFDIDAVYAAIGM